MVDHTLIDTPGPDWKAEDQRGARNNNDDDNQGGNMPSWMFKEESNRKETKNRDSKKPAQLKKNDNNATQDVKVQDRRKLFCWTSFKEASTKKSGKIHLLKIKEAMSSVDKPSIEDFQKNDSTLKKCFDRVGKLIIRENFVGEFFMKNG